MQRNLHACTYIVHACTCLILHVQLLLGFVLILFKVDKTRAHSALLTGEVRQIVANFDRLLVQVMEIWFLELHHSRTCGTFEQGK